MGSKGSKRTNKEEQRKEDGPAEQAMQPPELKEAKRIKDQEERFHSIATETLSAIQDNDMSKAANLLSQALSIVISPESNGELDDDCIRLVLNFMSLKEPIGSYVSELRAFSEALNGGNSICGHVFQAGERVYSCKTCGITSNSAICEECFSRDIGRHEKHKYQSFALTSAGGCCDCGDPVQLKISAFCSKHHHHQTDTTTTNNNNETEMKDIESIPQRFRSSTKIALDCVFAKFCEVVTTHGREKFIQGIADTIRNICEDASIGLQKVCGCSLADSGRLSSILLAYNNLAMETRCSLHLLILKLSSSRTFKIAMAKSIVELYDKFPIPIGFNETSPSNGINVENADFEDVYSFTAQVLPVQDIMHDLLLDPKYDIPNVFLNAIYNNFNPFLDQSQGVYNNLCGLSERNRLWRSTIETKEMLRYPENSKIFLEQSIGNGSILKWINVLSHMQGTDSFIRKCEGDPDDFKFATHKSVMFIDHAIQMQSQMFVQALTVTTPEKAIEFVRLLSNELVEHWIKFPISKDILSGKCYTLHLPLIRSISSFILPCIKEHKLSLQQILGPFYTNPEFAETILELELRLFAFISQVRNGLWVRNGLEFPMYIEASRVILVHDFAFFDIFALQIALSLLGPSKFIAKTFQIFCESDSLNEILSISDPQRLKLLEDALFLISTVAVERTFSSLKTPRDIVKYQAINFLCVTDLPFSYLIERIKDAPFGEPVTDLLEDALSEIATFSQSTSLLVGGGTGVFRLKPEFWKYFDPHFICLSISNREKAEERFNSTIQESMAPKNPISEPFPTLKPIISILCTENTLLSNLIKSVIKAQTNKEQTGEPKKPKPSLLARCLDIIECSKLTGSFDNAYKEIVSDLIVIAEDLKDPSGKTARRIIGLDSQSSTSSQMSNEPSKESTIKNKAKERQKALLEKFKQEQQKFLELHSNDIATTPSPSTTIPTSITTLAPNVQINDGKEAQEQEQEERICILCREELNLDEINEKPFGLVSHVCHSNILNILKQQEELKLGTKLSIGNNESANTDQNKSLFIQSCNHAMHFSCLNRFMEEQLQHFNPISKTADPNNGEFQCPLCHRFSNCVLPLININQKDEISQQLFSSIESFIFALILELNDHNVDQFVENMNTSYQSSTLCNVISNTISENEHFLRFHDSSLSKTQAEFLQLLVDCSKAYIHHLKMKQPLPSNNDIFENAVNSMVYSSSVEPSSFKEIVIRTLRSEYQNANAVIIGNHIQQEQFTAKQCCISIARRLLILKWCFRLFKNDSSSSSSSSSSFFPNNELHNIELDSLLELLSCPKSSELFNEQIINSTETTSGAIISCQPPLLPVFKLIQLPHEYATILTENRSKTCPNCRTTPDNPAICLKCGTFVCANSECCNIGGIGECTRHSEMCGGGIGVFLFLSLSVCIIVTPGHAGPWIAPFYLNQHQEEDIGLKRGDPLFLDESRFELISKLVASHSFDGSLPPIPSTWGKRI